MKSEHRRLSVLIFVLAACCVGWLWPASLSFEVIGNWTPVQPPTGDPPCLSPSTAQRTWQINAPLGYPTKAAQSLFRDTCKTQCVVHSVTVESIEWHATPGFFSGYSDLEFTASLRREGAHCQDSTIYQGHFEVEQGRRGDAELIKPHVARWAAQHYLQSYGQIFSASTSPASPPP